MMMKTVGFVAATMIVVGAAEEPEVAPQCNPVLDLAFLVDASGSVPVSGWEASQAFIKNITASLVVSSTDVQVAVAQFSTTGQVELLFQDGQSQLQVNTSVDGMVKPFGGLTYTNLGLDVVRQEIFTGNGVRSWPQVPRMLVVVTDGQSWEQENTAAAAATLRAPPYNVVITAVGVGPGPNPVELEAIAGDASRVITMDSYENLAASALTIAEGACDTTTTTTTPSTTTTPVPTTTTTPEATPDVADQGDETTLPATSGKKGKKGGGSSSSGKTGKKGNSSGKTGKKGSASSGKKGKKGKKDKRMLLRGRRLW
eukprot:m.54707 g.54707  ORF g.54707 m.54707 type:complete len:313 (-) comp7548_c0_seq1:122-1060(-)